MRAVGEEHELVAAFGERREHRFGRVDAAHRRVAAGEPLAADEDVGNDAPVIDGEIAAGAAEAGHHLVGDQQHAVAAADRGEARPVVVGRNQRTRGRADHRLGDDRRDRLGSLAFDERLDRVDARDAARGSREAERAAQAVAGRCLRPVDEQRFEPRAALRMAADGERAERRAVIGEIAADHLPAFGPTRRHMVLAREAQRGVHRLRTAAGEGDAGDAGRQPALHQPLGEQHALIGGEGRDEVAGGFERSRHGFGDFAAAVADVGDDRTARGVEDAAAVGRARATRPRRARREARAARYECENAATRSRSSIGRL